MELRGKNHETKKTRDTLVSSHLFVSFVSVFLSCLCLSLLPGGCLAQSGRNTKSISTHHPLSFHVKIQSVFFFTKYHKTTNLDYLDAAINFNQFSLLKTDKQQELYKLESKLGHMPKF